MGAHPHAFPRSHRLSGKLAFSAVYDARQRRTKGPLVVYRKANELGHARWGLSVSRRVGSAVTRNRIKRLLREAIRLGRDRLRGGYDYIIVVRPHQPLKLLEYQQFLEKLCAGS